MYPKPSPQHSAHMPAKTIKSGRSFLLLCHKERLGWDVLGPAGPLWVFSILLQITTSCVLLDLGTKEALLEEE